MAKPPPILQEKGRWAKTTPAPRPPAPPRTPARRSSSSNPKVAQVQRRLNAAGYHVTVDGIPGPQTDAAISQFNRDRSHAISNIVKTQFTEPRMPTPRTLDRSQQIYTRNVVKTRLTEPQMPLPEGLGHAIARMRVEKYSDARIDRQIARWHPDWTPQQRSKALQQAPRPLPGQNLGAFFAGLPRDYGMGPVGAAHPYAPHPTTIAGGRYRHGAALPVANLHVGDPLGIVPTIAGAIHLPRDIARFARHPGLGAGLAAGLDVAAVVPFVPLKEAGPLLRGANDFVDGLRQGKTVNEALDGARVARAGLKRTPIEAQTAKDVASTVGSDPARTTVYAELDSQATTRAAKQKVASLKKQIDEGAIKYAATKTTRAERAAAVREYYAAIHDAKTGEPPAASAAASAEPVAAAVPSVETPPENLPSTGGNFFNQFGDVFPEHFATDAGTAVHNIHDAQGNMIGSLVYDARPDRPSVYVESMYIKPGSRNVANLRRLMEPLAGETRPIKAVFQNEQLARVARRSGLDIQFLPNDTGVTLDPKAQAAEAAALPPTEAAPPENPPPENPPPEMPPGPPGEPPAPPEAQPPQPGGEPPLSPEEQLRQGVRGARSLYGRQRQLRSEELSRRAREVNKALTTIADPEEARIAAAEVMRGELPKIDFHGLTTLNDSSLRYLKQYVNQHATLPPFAKNNLNDALDAAVKKGKVPTPRDMRLIEQVFGKENALAFAQSAASRWNTALNVLNIPRTMQATADLSALMRQGLVAGASHPIIWGKSIPAMFRAARSPEGYRALMAEIEGQPEYPLALAGHVSFSDPGEGVPISVHEEQFASDLAAKIPGLGAIIKGSSRAYSAFLNKMRMDLFKNRLRIDLAAGHYDVHDEHYLKSIGKVINAATGRGSMPESAEQIMPALNVFMFSPRLMLSRINYLDPTWYVRLHPAARKEALRGLLATAGAVSSALYLFSQIPGVEIGSLDPRSADFGKLKIGNTRIDIAAGFQQYIRLASELGIYAASRAAHGLGYKANWNELVSSTSGKKSKFGSGYGQQTATGTVGKFFMGKASPPVSMAAELLNSQDPVGNKLTPKSFLEQYFLPLVLQDAKDLYNERHGGLNGIEWALAGYGLGAFGLGIQTYKAKPPKSPGASGGGGDAGFGSGSGGGFGSGGSSGGFGGGGSSGGFGG
jgi:peptidoglycan hydrolase-like protein with peptidoglycan-binding domain